MLILLLLKGRRLSGKIGAKTIVKIKLGLVLPDEYLVQIYLIYNFRIV